MGLTGTYGLNDVPGFEDDIEILEASYTSTSPDVAGGMLDVNTFPWELSSGIELESLYKP